MTQLYRVNYVFARLLIIIGGFGFLARYIEYGDFQFTALIPTLFGLVLTLFSNGLLQDNNKSALYSLFVAVFLLVGVGSMFIRNMISDEFLWDRKSLIFLFVTLGSLYYIWIAIKHFIRDKSIE
ncbi:MAG: hypothetical protein ACEPOV_11860 [Hyphomicrobiales bacterium]